LFGPDPLGSVCRDITVGVGSRSPGNEAELAMEVEYDDDDDVR
jgi:hypothetical protein